MGRAPRTSVSGLSPTLSTRVMDTAPLPSLLGKVEESMFSFSLVLTSVRLLLGGLCFDLIVATAKFLFGPFGMRWERKEEAPVVSRAFPPPLMEDIGEARSCHKQELS